MSLPAFFVNINFDEEKTKIESFLSKFTEQVDTSTPKKRGSKPTQRTKYLDLLTQVADRTIDTVEVSLDDVDKFDQTGRLVHNIEQNTKRYITLFYEVMDSLLPASETAPTDDSNPLEVLIYQRRQRDAQQEDAMIAEGGNSAIAVPMFPPALTRRFTLRFKPSTKFSKGVSVRDIKATSVGKMVRVKGMVTRVSNVKPMVVVVAYSCDNCGHEIFQEVVSENVNPLVICTSDSCRKNNIKGALHMQTRACKFLKFQEVKLQELTEQVPMGNIPRYMTVYLTENQTRSVSPGEMVYISGVVMPIPFTGFRALRAGLITDTYLDAHHIEHAKQQYTDMLPTTALNAQLQELTNGASVYHRLSQSIAPEIYGHEDIKKALLLLLVGGASKQTSDGMKIRGDLNICLMGDPGVAKSQLLKYISKLAPRAVYTTGRGSSGVGLTASVLRDPVTDEMVLEGGALVLADNGIACIDEFDKMDESDRTAIHEVMEQQTISISKAGITTTLNARTSILAAANPQYGRYNPRMKPTDNINLPAALLSRFDLLFLLLDKPSMDDDLRLAQHVTFVHRALVHPPREDQTEPIDLPLLRYYVSLAKKIDPVVPAEVGDYLVNSYVHMRSKAKEMDDFQYTCARTLLSVIRLATATARLRFSAVVEITDVDEALRLTEVSKSSLVEQDTTYTRDPISIIFELIKEMCTRSNGSLKREIQLSDVRERVISKGFSEEQMMACVKVYMDDDVWMMVGAGDERLRWLRIDEDDDLDE
ncbi:DNA replication licensing factor MCM7 [Batrachochytrium dendrobatidis]|nr:DNA replication licensing factor MCM7 [Batrachochytrium dendrobatidis]KAK5670623.1 DNA replication licensing factor MCM7 [Batrachochytrium dendrobatidis]